MTNVNATSSEHQVKDEKTSNQVEVEKHPKTATLLGEEVKIKGIAIPAINKDFDNMVDDAVKTIPEKELEQKQVEKKEEKPYSQEEAAGVALTGLSAVMGLVGKFTTAPLVVTQETQMIFAAMCTPLVLKYGKTIKGLLNPENVDLNSNVPEYLAIAAVGVVAVPSYLQVKEHNKQQKLKGRKDDEALSKSYQKANETGETQKVDFNGD